MKLSVAIMAHRDRADLVADLLQRLELDESHVVWDQGRDDWRQSVREWDTGRRSWQHHDPAADWHLVIQDDAIVCRDLIPGLSEALTQLRQESVVSLYSDGKRHWMQMQQRADHLRQRWIRHRTLVWGVAMAAPVRTISDLLDYCERTPSPNYDARIAAYYCRHLKWPAFYAWPSLADHRQVPSLLGHADGRHATKFVGEEASAIEWARNHPREKR